MYQIKIVQECFLFLRNINITCVEMWSVAATTEHFRPADTDKVSTANIMVDTDRIGAHTRVKFTYLFLLIAIGISNSELTMRNLKSIRS